VALSDSQVAEVSERLTAYCAPHPRPEVRRQLRHGFEIGTQHVILFEERPRFDRHAVWQRHDVAKFRWVARHREWRLYCQFRDLKWHLYEPRPSARRFATLLEEVDRDPTCIFWG